MLSGEDYGRRLVPNIVDERALNDPDRVVYSVPKTSDNVDDGFTDVSALAFANAVDRMAWWLESELGRGSSYQTVGYIGPHDLRYILLILGCIKAGYKALLISPRNSAEASLAVLEATDCGIWVLPKQQPNFLPQLLAQRSMRVLDIADVDEFLNPEPVLRYPYKKTFEEAADEPFCVFHTSGSTGLPKPIVWKHSLLATVDASRFLPESLGRPPWVSIFEDGDRFYSAFPFFHGAGLLMNILVNAFYNTCNVLGPAEVTPSLRLIDSLLDHGNIKVWSIIPSIIDDIGENESVHTKFKDSKIIIASGGPVTYASANKATESVRITNLTGTSEGLFMGSLLTEPEDWIYFSFHPYANFDFREIEKGVFEQYVVRDDRYINQFQGIFHTFPDIEEMTLKDLYTAHPTKPGLWLYKGRTDDMVVLSNGEKIHPTDMEAIISSHPAVSACLVVGSGHFQATLLIELANPAPKSARDQKVLLTSVYETVQRANASASSQARILKEYIMFAKPHMPFPRTDKNTVKRRMTVKLYQKEIEAFYTELENEDSPNFETEIDASTLERVTEGVKDVLMATFPLNTVIDSDNDLFHAGLNSLLAMRVAKCLRSAAEKYNVDKGTKSALGIQLIYANPTINQLAAAFYALVRGAKGSLSDPVEIQKRKMIEYRAQYAANMPQSRYSRQCDISPPSEGSNTTVLLTGSTGSLGSYLLHSLLQQRHITKIYCLNRSPNGLEKQISANGPRGLVTTFPPSRVHFIQADLSKPSFGLQESQYSSLLRETTHIIHNAWPVNFNLDITSFEPHIRGVRNMVDFCVNSPCTPSLFFVSTVATVGHLGDVAKDDRAVPETMTDVLTTIHGGYGASKQVSELILRDAAEKAGVDVTVCRVGQISGPVRRGRLGMWSKTEWFPTIITTSQALNLLPSTLGSMDRVDWIPVDILADVLLELSGVADLPSTKSSCTKDNNQTTASDTPSLKVYHAINPTSTTYSTSLLPTIHKHLLTSSSNPTSLSASPSPLQTTPFPAWVSALSRSQSHSNNNNNSSAPSEALNPARKLLPFFSSIQHTDGGGGGMPKLSTEEAERKSATLRALREEVQGERGEEGQGVWERWMGGWMGQWGL